MGEINLSIFNLAPMAMWIQDFSAVKKIFQQWQDEGIEDLEQYLLEDPERLQPCLRVIKTIQVNQSTLELYDAADLNEILESFARLHYEKISIEKVKFFVALWNKEAQCICPSINFTCKGKQIDILLKASVLPGYEDSWERLLLTTENVSDYQNARRFAESLFIHSPTALWVKDYSGIKTLFTQLQTQGVQNLELYLQQQPDFLMLCFQNIRSIDVNQALLNLFHASSKQHFYQNIHTLLNENSKQHFQNELLYLWQEHYHLERDCEYKTLDDKTIHVREQFMIFPNAHHTWDTVQIAYTDFTARKQLEEYLEFMSHRDELTQLYNRNFFNAEIKRLQHETVFPTACIYLDINGLKTINDLKGHHCGDLLLKRFANILRKATENTAYSISRIGGDEFVILMPQATASMAYQLFEKIQDYINEDNRLLEHTIISVAAGIGCTDAEPNIENLVRMTDLDMYEQKNQYYQNYRS